jgi:ethanolamine ammonia-lyase large subunit
MDIPRSSRLRRRLRANACPTQHCVLSHVTVQLKALELGCPMDLMFQSVAGTEGANRAFGIDVALLDEAAHADAASIGPSQHPNLSM